MKITKCKHNNQTRWRVDWRIEGKRFRRFFPNQDEASDHIEELNGIGDQLSTLSKWDRRMLWDCYCRAKEKGYTVHEACLTHESTGMAKPSTVTVKELCDLFLADKVVTGCRPETVRIYGVTMKQFSKGRESDLAANVTTMELQKWVDSQITWGPARRKDVRTELIGLYAWGIRKELLPANRNPARGLSVPKDKDSGPVTILTVDRVAEALDLARNKFPDLLPWLVVALFTGMRTEELTRIDFGAIQADHIDLRSIHTKTRVRRYVPIRPVLKAWLGTCRNTGMICTADWADRSADFRQFLNWPKNVMRHTAISYALGSGESAARVAEHAGNSEIKIMKHYREPVLPQAAAEFWAMTPEALDKRIEACRGQV